MSDDLDLRDDEDREDGDGPIALSDDDIDEVEGGEDADVESLDALADAEAEEDEMDIDDAFNDEDSY